MKRKCYNCRYAGKAFKSARVTSHICEHPKYTDEMFESGKLSAWDVLENFYNTCEDHEFKESKSSKN